MRPLTLAQPSAYLAGVVAGDGWCTRTLGLRVADEDFARALTLCQPWATLIAAGAKRIETRNWAPHYRGRLAIHAAKGLNGLKHDPYERVTAGELRQRLADLVNSSPFWEALREAPGVACDQGGHVDADSLPRGAIVATCELAVVVSTELRDAWLNHSGSNRERAFGNFNPGRYCWLLDDVVPLPQPLPARGEQMLWHVDPDLAPALAVQEQRGRDIAAGLPACEVCGCTENAACAGGCHWVTPGLCSACAETGLGSRGAGAGSRDGGLQAVAATETGARAR